MTDMLELDFKKKKKNEKAKRIKKQSTKETNGCVCVNPAINIKY